jgi:predicted RNA binding protein YcfA (HicA-like mRNA interferase family)
MLRADGWARVRATGSHYIFRHPTKGTVTVPYHGANNEIAPGTLKAILKQAGLD